MSIAAEGPGGNGAEGYDSIQRTSPRDKTLAAETRDIIAAILAMARLYRSLGFSPLPIKTDGSKAPALATWAEFQERYATTDEIEELFGNELRGIAIVTGS